MFEHIIKSFTWIEHYFLLLAQISPVLSQINKPVYHNCGDHIEIIFYWSLTSEKDFKDLVWSNLLLALSKEIISTVEFPELDYRLFSFISLLLVIKLEWYWAGHNRCSVTSNCCSVTEYDEQIVAWLYTYKQHKKKSSEGQRFLKKEW